MTEQLAAAERSNGFSSLGTFIGESEARLLDRADPALRESVIIAGNVLTQIARTHEAFLGEPKHDVLAGRWRAQAICRQLRMSALLDSETHTKDCNKGIRKAVELWASRGLLTVTEVATSGRPFTVLNLNLEKFESQEALTSEWKSYWGPIERRLKSEHIQRMSEFYRAGTWVAKIDFSVNESWELSPFSGGSFKRFSKGQIVPTQSLMSLQGFGEQPDYGRVEPLGDRVVISVQHVCAHCRNVETSHHPVAREKITTSEGAITLL